MEYYLAAKKEMKPRVTRSHWGTLKTLYSLKEAGHKSRIPFIGHGRRDRSPASPGSGLSLLLSRNQGF